MTGTGTDQVRLDSDLYRALTASKRLSISEGSSTIYTEAVAVAIISSGPNLSTQILSLLEADIDKIHKKLKDLLKRRCAMDSAGNSDYSSLSIGEEAKAALRRKRQLEVRHLRPLQVIVVVDDDAMATVFGIGQWTPSCPRRDAMARRLIMMAIESNVQVQD